MGTVDKTVAGNGISGVGAGISRIDAPFYNHSIARASAGTLQIAGGGITGSSLEAAAGARVLLTTSEYVPNAATWNGAVTGQLITATTTLTNHGPGSVPAVVHPAHP